MSDPKNYGEGRTRYTAYLVESPTNKCEVRRRYSDFQWLYRHLMIERPGAIVPIIPHKQALRESVRFSDELLNERQAQLQKFMTLVVSHPELHDAPCLETFLTTYNEEWEKIRSGDETAQPNQNGEPTGFLGKVKAKLAIAGAMELEKTPDDAAMEIMEDYLNSTDTQVKILAKESSALVKVSQDEAKALQSMGQACSSLGEKPFPGAYNDPLGELATSLSTRFGGISVIVGKEARQSMIKLDEPMQDLARDVQAAKLAMQRRKEILWDYTRKTNAVKTKKQNLEKLKATEQEVSQAQQDAKAAWKEVEVVTKRVQREMDNFREAFLEKFRAVVKNYSQLQVEYHKHVEKKWAEIIPLVVSDGETESAPAPAFENGEGAPNGVVALENVEGEVVLETSGAEESQVTELI